MKWKKSKGFKKQKTDDVTDKGKVFTIRQNIVQKKKIERTLSPASHTIFILEEQVAQEMRAEEEEFEWVMRDEKGELPMCAPCSITKTKDPLEQFFIKTSDPPLQGKDAPPKPTRKVPSVAACNTDVQKELEYLRNTHKNLECVYFALLGSKPSFENLITEISYLKDTCSSLTDIQCIDNILQATNNILKLIDGSQMLKASLKTPCSPTSAVSSLDMFFRSLGDQYLPAQRYVSQEGALLIEEREEDEVEEEKKEEVVYEEVVIDTDSEVVYESLVPYCQQEVDILEEEFDQIVRDVSRSGSHVSIDEIVEHAMKVNTGDLTGVDVELDDVQKLLPVIIHTDEGDGIEEGESTEEMLSAQDSISYSVTINCVGDVEEEIDFIIKNSSSESPCSSSSRSLRKPTKTYDELKDQKTVEDAGIHYEAAQDDTSSDEEMCVNSWRGRSGSYVSDLGILSEEDEDQMEVDKDLFLSNNIEPKGDVVEEVDGSEEVHIDLDDIYSHLKGLIDLRMKSILQGFNPDALSDYFLFKLILKDSPPRLAIELFNDDIKDLNRVAGEAKNQLQIRKISRGALENKLERFTLENLSLKEQLSAKELQTEETELKLSEGNWKIHELDEELKEVMIENSDLKEQLRVQQSQSVDLYTEYQRQQEMVLSIEREQEARTSVQSKHKASEREEVEKQFEMVELEARGEEEARSAISIKRQRDSETMLIKEGLLPIVGLQDPLVICVNGVI